ncbi:uncharacterized protein M6B38_306310 [Iris pallida]|uniref:Uncharacterized protein n=1 Tax=Iris pallida TaxID=29817 RepID=A0AAX6HMB3_IRIPA|nr:uncharacterized protein M6B38_306310 [Iris pallida]
MHSTHIGWDAVNGIPADHSYWIGWKLPNPFLPKLCQPLLLYQLLQVATTNNNKKNKTKRYILIERKKKKQKQKLSLSNIKKMKREGWQRGTVRCAARTTTGPADADADAGEEEAWSSNAKAPSVAKPSNHSKFSGKCKRARCAACHSHPVSKSRDKAKGTHKLRSCDVALNHRLVSWRVAPAEVVEDGLGHWSKYSGFSASGILDQLSSERDCRGDDEDQDVVEEEEEEEESDGMLAECSDAKEEDEEHDDDDEEEFCQVGIVSWEYIDGEDWCLVHEM